MQLRERRWGGIKEEKNCTRPRGVDSILTVSNIREIMVTISSGKRWQELGGGSGVQW